MPVYLIKPLEKKSVVYHVEMYRNNPDGSISWFHMDETYSWGQGFIEEDMDFNLPKKGANIAHAKLDGGWGSEFDGSCGCLWEFSDDIGEDEKEKIQQEYSNMGVGWLIDGEHDWQTEDEWVNIYAPYQVSLCEDDGTVIEENVELQSS